MNKIYDFEKNSPPLINESALRARAKADELKHQILLLRIAALLCMITLGVFALFIFRDSMLVSITSIVMMTFYFMGNGIISVLFYKKGINVKG